MNAADLREWVALVTPELTPDGQGGMVEVYPSTPPEPDTPAKVQQQSGDESFVADQVATLGRYTVTIRYESWIHSALRVYWRSQWLDIVSPPINVDGRDEWLEIRAERHGSGAQ